MHLIGRFLWLIITLIAVAVAMVFAISNTQTVTLRFWPLTGQLDITLWMLTLGVLAVGAVFGGGLVWLSLIASRTRNWSLQRQLGKAEQRAISAEDRLAAAEADATQDVVPPSRRLQ